jgi:hypothetical protein
MDTSDPRHGTYAGAVQHWLNGNKTCNPCSRAGSRYRQQRILRTLQGDNPTVPATGMLRRIRALYALGWTGPQVADASGLSVHTLRSIGYHASTTVRAATAEAIKTAYEQLSMNRPEGRYADRARAAAARHGWAVPLAWDEDTIDNPHAQPDTGATSTGDAVARRIAGRLEDLEHMAEVGVSSPEAARRLGLSDDGLEKWLANHGRSDLYTRMSPRDHNAPTNARHYEAA